MVSIFLDTSAIFALLDSSDDHHKNAAVLWDVLEDADSALVTTNYVLIEALALVQSRLGMDALQALQSRIAPVATIHWVDETLHNQGSEMVMVARQRRLSLVDCVSFAAMRQMSIDSAFTFDRHFREHGFRIIP